MHAGRSLRGKIRSAPAGFLQPLR